MSKNLKQKVQVLEERLKEAEATLDAIRNGKIDAIVVQGKDLPEIYTLKGVDYTYRILIERMNEGAAVLSKEGIVLYSNKKLVDLLGLEKKNFVGEFLSKFLLSSEKEKLNALLVSALTDVASEKIYYVHPEDGQLKSLLFSANPMPKDTGADIGLVVTDLSQVEEKERLQKIQDKLEEIVLDRTRRLQEAHEEVKKINEKLKIFSNVIEQATDMILITDKDQNIIYVNPAFEKITGYTLKEISGKTPLVLLDQAQNAQDLYDNILARLNRGQCWTGTTWSKRKNGEVFKSQAVIFPIKNDAGEIINYASIRRDVTYEEHLKEQVYQSQKLESLGKLTGGVAHDFNNLLTVINGFSKLGMELINKDHPLYNYLEQIYKAGERASHLTAQLLTFSRKQVMSPKKININQLFRETQKMLRRLISEDIELEFHLDENVQPIKADVTQIDQILMNLVVNARDAILEKERATEKKIIVRTQQIEVTEEHTRRLLDLKPGPHVLIQVSDTGVGMSNEVRNHIFEPFFTTKKDGKGTGLGLSTVYGIIKQNNAVIHVKSELGKGTTFSIYWPNYLQDDDQQEENQEDVIKGKKQTILIVEDDENVRKLLGETLKKLNYSVVSASNGLEAVEYLIKHKNKVDAIITDLVMPKMNGITFFEKIKQLGLDIPVLFSTGYADEHLEKLVKDEYKDKVIQKPYTAKNLAQKLAEVLKH